MHRTLIVLALLSAGLGSLRAETQASSPKKRTTAIYAPGPIYPMEVGGRHLTGTGVFAMHVRADGTVSSSATSLIPTTAS